MHRRDATGKAVLPKDAEPPKSSAFLASNGHRKVNRWKVEFAGGMPISPQRFPLSAECDWSKKLCPSLTNQWYFGGASEVFNRTSLEQG